MTAFVNPKDKVGSRKVALSAVPAEVLGDVSLAFLEGDRKHGRHNFRVSPIVASIYYDAAWRHLAAWWEGQNIDPASGLSHVTKAIAGLMVLRSAMMNEKWDDDRPPRVRDQGWVDHQNVMAAEIIDRYPDRAHVFTHTGEGVEPPAAVPEGGWTSWPNMVVPPDCPLVEPPTLQDRIDRAFDVVGTDEGFLADAADDYRCSFCGAAEEKEEHAFDCPNGVDLSQFKRLRALARAITTVEPAPAPVFEGGYVDEIVPRVPGQSERIRRLHDAEDALTGGDGWHNEETE